MADVFVSYSRKDQTIVRELVDALSSHGKEAWVDWEGIPPTADWLEEIYAAIEESGSFLFVISPGSAASKVCLDELTHAEQLGKRIIPVNVRPVDPSDLPPAVAKRNWIMLGDGRTFDESVATLIEALDTDLDWVREHTRWLGKAREWERHGRDASFLLRGSELRAAEDWLTTPGAAEKEPPATPLQNEYVLTSRQGATRRQRAFVIAVSVALLVTMALAVAAFLQRNRAISERKTAVSELLASISRQRAEKSLDTGLLLAVAAYDTKKTSAARDALLAGVQRTESMERMTRFDHANPPLFAVSGDGRVVATVASDGIRVHRLEGTAEFTAIPAKEVVSLALDESGSRLATVEGPPGVGRLVIREISAGSGVVRRPTPPSIRRAQSASFAPGGSLLAVGTWEAYVFLVDLESGDVTKVVVPRGSTGAFPIHVLAFDPTATLLAAGSPLGTHAIDLRGAPRYRGPVQADYPLSVALADSETLLLVTGSELVVVDLRTGQEACPRAGAVSRVYVDAAGRIVAADESGAIRVANEPCGEVAHVLRGHGTSISALSSGRARGQLVSIDASGIAILWDTEGAQLISRRSTAIQLASDIATGWGPGEVIVAADSGVAQVRSPTNIARLERSPAGATMLATAREESILAAAGRPAALWIGARYARSDVMGTRPGLSVALTPDGKRVALGQIGGRVDVWDLENDEHVGPLSTGGQGSVTALALDSGGRLAAGDNAGRLVTWEGDERKPTVLRPGGTAIEALAFSPDDRLLVSASGDEIMLWERGEVEPVRLPQTHRAVVNDLAFTPSGEQLISADDSGVLLVWDVQTGRVLGEALRTGMESIEGIDVDPGGSLVAVGGAGTMFRLDPSLWDVEAAKERICAFAGRPLSEEEWSEAVPGLEPRSTC